MNHMLLSVSCIICIIAVAFSGCTGTSPAAPATTGQPAPAGNPAVTIVTDTPVVPVTHIIVIQNQSGTTASLVPNGTITLILEENPSTGYRWNLTTTGGLNVTSDTFSTSDATGKLVGAGGNRVWNITAARTGGQKIEAIYNRPWEQTTGNETMFTMTVNVIPA